MKTNYEKLMKINYEKLLIFYLPFTQAHPLHDPRAAVDRPLGRRRGAALEVLVIALSLDRFHHASLVAGSTLR